MVNGTEVVLTNPLGQAKGVVLLFHGCQHSALDWGYASPSCPLCVGKPFPEAASESLLKFDIVSYCGPNPPASQTYPCCLVSPVTPQSSVVDPAFTEVCQRLIRLLPIQALQNPQHDCLGLKG